MANMAIAMTTYTHVSMLAHRLHSAGLSHYHRSPCIVGTSASATTAVSVA